MSALLGVLFRDPEPSPHSTRVAGATHTRHADTSMSAGQASELLIFWHPARMSLDPVASNPEHYKVVFENERVRVLEYLDQPGDKTTPHQHPDSIMYTLSAFRRRLVSRDVQREVELEAGSVAWLPAQDHHGENIGELPRTSCSWS
jgi:hypothetical protein